MEPKSGIMKGLPEPAESCCEFWWIVWRGMDSRHDMCPMPQRGLEVEANLFWEKFPFARVSWAERDGLCPLYAGPTRGLQ